MTLDRRTPLPRSSIKPKRATPRRREAPRWTADEWADANALLMARCGGRCDCCGQPLDGRLERHHRQRRRDGGDRLSNICCLLPACHKRWTEHPADAMDLGLIVSAYVEDPATVPVLWRGQAWKLLDDTGGMTGHAGP